MGKKIATCDDTHQALGIRGRGILSCKLTLVTLEDLIKDKKKSQWVEEGDE